MSSNWRPATKDFSAALDLSRLLAELLAWSWQERAHSTHCLRCFFLNHFKPICFLPQNWDDDPAWASWGLWATRQLWKRRTMSRTAAKKVIAQEAFEASMKGIVCDTHPAVRDEAPQAYKDLGQASWQRRWKSWNIYPEDPWNHKQGTAARSGLGLFTSVTCKCNVSFAKCFENFGNHLLQGMAMIVSPLPLVDIVPDLNIQKFVLRNLCMDAVWNEIFRVIPTLVQSLNNHKKMWASAQRRCQSPPPHPKVCERRVGRSVNNVSKCTETLPGPPPPPTPPYPKVREIMWRRRVWMQTWLRAKLVEV